jgi:CRP/FNR family cyclic AMP-dependent transcriptional regulator
MSTLISLQQSNLEDPLAYLTRAATRDYRNGQTIYGYEQPPAGIYLIIGGHVKVDRRTDSGRHVVLDIYQPDEFFGESGLVGPAPRAEYAVALGSTSLMMWNLADIEETMTRRPKLALALMQLLIQRNMDFGSRIESFSVDPVDRRLARCLIRFSERLAIRAAEGWVEMTPLTHEFLAQYVGTSREIVSHYMNIFRRWEYLDYSRKSIRLNSDRLREWIRQDYIGQGPRAKRAA